jgi:hypothetical protein
VAAGNPGGYTSNSVTEGFNEIHPCITLPDEVQAKMDEATEKIKAGELEYTHVTDLE